VIKLQSTANLAAVQGVKSLVYGESGAGKTYLISTAPRPVIFSAESGLLSLRKFQLPYHIISSYKDLEEVYNWSTKSAEMKQFDTIALDSISEIAEVILVDLKLKHKDPRKAYGEVQENVVNMIRGFRDIPQKHVYFSAKQGTVKDGTNGALYFGPLMPGQQLGVQLPYMFDELFQLSVFVDPATNQEHRALRCKKDNQYQAKDRSGALDMWEQPNLTDVFNKIMKG